MQKAMQFLILAFMAFIAVANAQPESALQTFQASRPVTSNAPIVDQDGRVTFTLGAPDARQVNLILEGKPGLPMSLNKLGIWTLRTEPLEPDFYTYYFVVDAAPYADHTKPRKTLVDGGFKNLLHVPGPPSLLWEQGEAPRGEVRRHAYHSGIAGDDRDLFVYLPPGYDLAGEQRYPVLYLLHGVTDDATGWTSVGRANIILDNLIARGEAAPMIIVMPLGYGFADPGRNLKKAFAGPLEQRPIMEAFARIMLEEIVPLVETNYRVAPGRESRAIAGLSMGGSQAVYLGLNHPEQFAWIGSFGGAFMMFGNELDAWFPRVAGAGGVEPSPRLFWRTVGEDDFVLYPNEQFGKWLDERSVKSESSQTPGGHTWAVFRRALCTFAPQLFRP